jgi:hypothetical protein
MAIGNFLEWLYAKTYIILSGIYPKICPQEMGIISEMRAFRNQENLDFWWCFKKYADIK